MNKLSYDLLILINHNLDLFKLITLSQTNKFNYLLCKNKIKKYFTSLIKIQKFYKNHRTYLPFEESYMNIYFEPPRKRKNFIIRCFIARYPKALLYQYPENFMEKTNIYNREPKKKILKMFIENLPLLKNRTLRNIQDFLHLDYITIRDIVYVGW